MTSTGFTSIPGRPTGTWGSTELGSKSTFTVAGCDPGLANLGLGAVREHGLNAENLESVLVRTSSRTEPGIRLQELYTATLQFLQKWQPDALAIEGQYFHQQRGTAFKVGQATGVVLLAAAECGVEVFEYGPMQVKQTLVGTGRASKDQVAYMVRGILGLKSGPLSSHSADALALALTHLAARRINVAGSAAGNR